MRIIKIIDSKKNRDKIFYRKLSDRQDINHPIAFDKLRYYGVSGNTLDRFENYLTNPSQVVEGNEKLSNKVITK